MCSSHHFQKLPAFTAICIFCGLFFINSFIGETSDHLPEKPIQTGPSNLLNTNTAVTSGTSSPTLTSFKL